jgi:hypothetical protein
MGLGWVSAADRLDKSAVDRVFRFGMIPAHGRVKRSTRLRKTYAVAGAQRP